MKIKIKVLQISNRFIIGGPSIILTILHSQMGIEFVSELLVGKKESHEQDAKFLLEKHGLSYEEVPSMNRKINPINDLKAFFEIKNFIQKYQPDIVHTHAAKPSVLGRLAAYICKVPVIIHTYHGHIFHDYFSKPVTFFIILFERFLAKFSTKIIAISEQQKSELVNIYKICSADKIVVIPLGLDLNPFYENQTGKRIAFRKKFEITDDEIVIGIIGRLVSVKNHALFINAVSEVIKCTSKKIRIMIVGDGEEKNNMMSQLNMLNIPFNYYPENRLPEIVTFTSWITDMDEVYAGLDIVALSSLNEGTPVTLIEGQAACKPIVTTNVGGVKDIVLENTTAFCTPSGNIKSFSNALLQLIENDDLRIRMGNNGYEHVKANFDKSRLIGDIENLYKTLLKEKRTNLSGKSTKKNNEQSKIIFGHNSIKNEK